MRPRHASSLALTVVLTAACAASRDVAVAPAPTAGTAAATTALVAWPAPGTIPPQLYAVLWMQTAAEYDAAAQQAYATARAALEEALADPAWTALPEQADAELAGRPPAVILDVDETVLDNSREGAREIVLRRPYNDPDWEKWVAERAATLVPGAAEFLAAAQRRGVAAFLVTNRTAAMTAATLDNLRRLGVEVPAERVLGKDEARGWGSDKSSRRALVARTHRVLLLVGDDLNDFVATAGKTREQRDALVRDAAARWGRQWIILPNPAYGSWERALYSGLPADATREQKLQRLLDALDPGLAEDAD